MKRLFALAAVLSLALPLAACSSGSDDKPAAETGNSGSGSKVELQVFAAASLTKAFTEIGEMVKQEHPNIDPKFSFLGSKTLVEQMEGGAPADVFASADQKNMDKAIEKGLVEQPIGFATNVLTLIVPKGNPGKITGLDNSLEGKKLVICAKGVPCGNATATLAEKLGVTLKPVSEEQKVTDVRGKVESGEADAGLVYTTDAKAAGDKVDVIKVPGAEQVVNAYPIAVVKNSRNQEAAKIFMEAVLSPKGQEILAKYGFGKPAS